MRFLPDRRLPESVMLSKAIRQCRRDAGRRRVSILPSKVWRSRPRRVKSCAVAPEAVGPRSQADRIDPSWAGTLGMVFSIQGLFRRIFQSSDAPHSSRRKVWKVHQKKNRDRKNPPDVITPIESRLVGRSGLPLFRSEELPFAASDASMGSLDRLGKEQAVLPHVKGKMNGTWPHDPSYASQRNRVDLNQNRCRGVVFLAAS